MTGMSDREMMKARSFEHPFIPMPESFAKKGYCSSTIEAVYWGSPRQRSRKVVIDGNFTIW
jgi:hypothetical protein